MATFHLKILPLLLCMCCICCSCTSMREGRLVIEVADSLRVNEGVTCDDSLALANAYTTFGHWRLIYPDDYARSCYYYGRMLRNRNDQVAAMQAFIRGKRAPYVQRFIPLPHFTDYHILGRIYSNMGTMCHLANELELSYDMYEYCFEQFYKLGDSTSYCYALNAMALELAEQKQHDETLDLLARIEAECTDSNVLTKIWETKAILYRSTEQYDSAIFAARELYRRGYYAATGYVVLAQSFWCMHQYDSALSYAQLVMRHPYASYQDKFNMLYILTYNDSTIDKDEVKKRSEERADIDKEILDPLHIQLAQAVNMLRRELYMKPHYISIGLLIFSICIVGAIAWIAVVRIKRHRKQLYAETEQERQKQHDLQRQQVTIYAERKKSVVQNCEIIYKSSNWKDELHWNDYDSLCKTADQYFFLLASKLRTAYKLDDKEVRLCILVLLHDFSNKQLAHLLNYSESGIGTFKYRISKKFNIPSKDLRSFLLDFAVYGS